MTPPKRYTLAATLIALQNARVLDDLAEMFIKRMLRIHRHAREALALDRLKHQERTDGLIHKLHEVIVAWGTEGNAEERLQAIGTVLAPDSRILLEQCEAQQAQTGNNYYPYMWRFYQGHRSTLLRIWRALKFRSTTQDRSLGRAFDLVLENETSRAEWLSLSEPWSDLDWVPDTWWRLVTGEVKRQPVERVHRRFLELCVFTQVMWDLKSGDAAIEGSREYADYRDQLISEDEAANMTASYEQEAGISIDAQRFVSERRQWLTSITQQTDRSFPENAALRIENGEPVLTKLLRKKTPARLAWLEATIKAEMEQVPILDALADTEKLLHWTRFFGPLSGLETKLVRESVTCWPPSAMAAIWGRAKLHDQCRVLIAGRLLGSINGTSRKTRSMRPSRQSSTPTTTSPFPACGAQANMLPRMARVGTCTNKISSPNTRSGMEAMAASATTMSPIPILLCSATSFHAVSGKRSTSWMGCSRTKAISNLTFSTPTRRDNPNLFSGSRICSASS